MEICMFSKHLQEYGFTETAKSLKGIGINGVDLTVRPKGHVAPEAAADKLPEAVEAFKDEGVEVTMITTEITAPDQDHARTILETAVKCGIRFYKIGYYMCEEFGAFKGAFAETKAKLKELTALSKEVGILGGYHNHSGPYVGAYPIHIAELISDLDKDAVCSYFDVGHAILEGACRGWQQSMEILSGRIGMLALKDLIIDDERGWERAYTVPMGEGLVPWKMVVETLKQIIDDVGPVSYHGEYNLPAAEVAAQVKRDKAFFEGVWKE